MSVAGFAGKEDEAREATPAIVAECWTCVHSHSWENCDRDCGPVKMENGYPIHVAPLNQNEAEYHRAAGHDVREVR